MYVRLPFFLLALLMTATLLAQAGVEYTTQRGGFAARFPREPVFERTEGANPVFTYTAQVANSVFMVAYNDLDDPIEDIERATQEILDVSAKGFAEGFGGEIVRRKAIRMGPLAGTEFQVRADDGFATVRMFLVGRRIYQVVNIIERELPVNPSGRRFLDSFRLHVYDDEGG